MDRLYRLHSAISNWKPIQEPAIHGGLMELNACDRTAYTACFTISAERTQPSSIFLCPNPCFTWQWLMEFSCSSCETQRKKKDKSFLQHTVSWAIKDDWTFHVSIWKMKNRQIASAPFYWNLTGKGQLVWNALWNFTQPDTDMQAFSIYTLLTNHLESVNSSTVCSMRPWVQHLKP